MTERSVDSGRENCVQEDEPTPAQRTAEDRSIHARTTSDTTEGTTETAIEEIKSLIGKETSETIRARFEIGRIVDKVCNAPDKYGANPVKKMAQTVAWSETMLYDTRLVFMMVQTQKRVSELVEMRDEKRGRSLTWSHIAAVAQIINSGTQEKLLEHWRKTGCSVQELRALGARKKPAKAVPKAAHRPTSTQGTSTSDEDAGDNPLDDRNREESADPSVVSVVDRASDAVMHFCNRADFALRKLESHGEANDLILRDRIELLLGQCDCIREKAASVEEMCRKILNCQNMENSARAENPKGGSA